MSINDLLPKPNKGTRLSLLRKIKAGKEVLAHKAIRLAKDGRVVDVWFTATALTDDLGNVTGIATTERDIEIIKKVVKMAAKQVPG